MPTASIDYIEITRFSASTERAVKSGGTGDFSGLELYTSLRRGPAGPPRSLLPAPPHDAYCGKMPIKIG